MSDFSWVQVLTLYVRLTLTGLPPFRFFSDLDKVAQMCSLKRSMLQVDGAVRRLRVGCLELAGGAGRRGRCAR